MLRDFLKGRSLMRYIDIYEPIKVSNNNSFIREVKDIFSESKFTQLFK